MSDLTEPRPRHNKAIGFRVGLLVSVGPHPKRQDERIAR